MKYILNFFERTYTGDCETVEYLNGIEFSNAPFIPSIDDTVFMFDNKYIVSDIEYSYGKDASIVRIFMEVDNDRY